MSETLECEAEHDGGARIEVRLLLAVLPVPVDLALEMLRRPERLERLADARGEQVEQIGREEATLEGTLR